MLRCWRFASLGQVIRGPRMLMITATAITATTITVMRPRQFVITVTMRIPRTHAPPTDTGDQISSLTVYSSAPARGSPVGTDADITAAVVMAYTAAAVAVASAVAGNTAVAVILQEVVADTAAAVAVTTAVAGDTAVAVILQEDVADTPPDMVGMLAVDIVGTAAVPDSVAVVVTAVMVTAVVMVTTVAVTVVMVTAVADTKSAISSRLGEKGWPKPAFLFDRVARRSCGRPALSELGVKVSLHPAQALRTPL